MLNEDCSSASLGFTATTRKGQQLVFNSCAVALHELHNYRLDPSLSLPKIGVLILSYQASELLPSTVNRIPSSLVDFITEIFIFDDKSQDDTFALAQKLTKHETWEGKITAYQNPRNLGYGGNQKAGYQYAIEKDLDYVILLHGDGQYAPEYLPEIILKIIKHKSDVIFCSRMKNKRDALKGGMPFYKWVGNQVLTFVENMALNTNLSEFHTGYRCYSTDVLRRIAFHENTNKFHFDSEIIVQLRALNVRFDEVAIQAFYGNETCHVNGLRYAFNVVASVIMYRLHQLHIVRRDAYIVKNPIRYTRKWSPFSSHSQILETIGSSGTALDLGGANGILTRDLLEKDVDSYIVDVLPENLACPDARQYIRCDLENPRSLVLDQKFDYVLMADLVEHLVNAKDLMHFVRGYLKPDGKLVISTPNIAIWLYRISLLIGRFNYSEKGTLDKTHVKFYTLSSFLAFIREAGYEVTQVRYTSLPFEVIFESQGKSRIIRFIDWAYYQLARVWPRMFAYQFVVEAKANLGVQ